MRKLYPLSTLVLLAILFGNNSYSQDFSNKGKDFWVAYGYHQIMNAGNQQDMRLYFAAEQNANVTVSIPGIGYTANYFVPANSVLSSAPIPKNTPDARLTAGSSAAEDKGIHITSDKNIVAYAHIYNMSVSGATILYPTPTLGKEYYSINYTNLSNIASPPNPGANCWFYVVAADTGTTKVEITPSATTTIGWVAGTTYTISLTQGQVFNVMGTYSGTSGVDLTGSLVKSVASGGAGCKRIAVFSGSGRIAISCNGSAPSSDNYMVQSMPKAAWGQKYLTTPAAAYNINNGNTFTGSVISFFRICVADPTTVVRINGAVTGLPLLNNFYYEIPQTTAPQLIEADKPITVAQYIPSTGSSGCGTVGGDGDPEVFYLSPVEQSIAKVLWLSCSQFAINTNKHYINVVIPNGGTAISSFQLDGVPVPASSFAVHPQDPNYSYVVLNVSSAGGIGLPHIIQSDSSFNAIAYGYGSFESYGYNAGTNVRDLYQQIGIYSQFGIEPTPTICRNTPFKFKVSLPYVPDSMYWDFNGAVGMFPNNTNVMVSNVPVNSEDSTTIVNGKTIHWYSLPTFYSFTNVGTYPITIRTYVPNNDCGSVQDIDFDLTVIDPPAADFSFTNPGCAAESVQFTETTPQTPKPTYSFWWDFGDPLSGAVNNTSNLRNPVHTFSGPGTYMVRFANITTSGCLSDTAQHQVVVPPMPNASIAGPVSPTVCLNGTANVTFTGTAGGAPFTFYYSINGGGVLSVSSAAGPPPSNTATVTVNTTVAGPYTYTLDSVRTTGSAACVTSLVGLTTTVTVNPDHAIALSSAPATTSQAVCLNTAITSITYTLSGGATGATVTGLPAGVTYSVAGTTLTISGSPTTDIGSPFSYSITTTGNSCVVANAIGSITVNPIHAIALSSAAATASQTVCINAGITPITYTLSGGATGATVTGLPAGVTSSVAGGVLTISGTPTTTVGSPFNYSITTTGNSCLTANSNGSITVNPAHSITLASGNTNQTACVNIVMGTITYTLSGGATGATVTGLPAGVTYSVVGTTLTISGTPSTAVGSPFNFVITTTGNTCTGATLNGSITINPDHAINLTSGNSSQTGCINTAITPITYTLSGGATGATVTGLPTGVTGSVAGGVLTISGTPTTAVGSPFNYSITTTGNACVTASANGILTVNPAHAIALSSAPSTTSQAVCINTAITSITYTLSGGATGATVTGLPAGVTYSVVGTTVTITGTPSTAVGSPFNYLITTTGNACAGAISNGSITVNSNHTIALSSAAATASQTVCINTGIAAITYTLSGGATGATVTGLPAGVTSSVAGGVLTISGSPTTGAGSPYNYSITTTGNSCVTATANGTISVNPVHAMSLTSAAATTSQTLCINTALTSITYTLSGGATGANVTGLPAGVTSSVVGTTLTISGTPSTAVGSPFNFTITTTGNSCLTASANGTITVNANHAIALSSAAFTANQSVCINTAITVITYTLSGGATGATVTGLPAGVTSSVAGGVLTISGTPTSTAGSPYNYSIITTGNSCVTATSNGTIAVTPAHSVSLSSAPASDNQTVCINTAIVTITYTLGGGATGAAVTGLPAGVTSSVVGNVLTITGTPTSTAGSPYNYTITTSGNSCTGATSTGTIRVNADHAIALSSAAATTNQNVCVNTAVTSITYTLSGGATGATVTGLPAGVTSSVAGTTLTISGTPTSTAGSPYNYSITTTGNSCVTATSNGTIAVTPAHAIALSSAAATTSQALCINNALTSITYTLSGGASGATVTGLPAGVASSVVGNVLTISGTPTTSAGSPFSYSITTTGNSCAIATSGGTITVNPDHAITRSSAASTDNQTVCTGKAITNITYTLSGGATGATVTGLPAGVTSSVAGNTVTISGSPSTIVGSPFNYTINTTGNGCVAASANGIITVLLTPTVQFDAVPGICADVPAFQLTALPGSGVFSGTGVTPGGMFTPATAGAGDHMIRYTFTAANGCSNFQDQKISVYPLPIVDAGPDKGVIEGGQVMLTPVITANFPVTYLWTPALYLNDPTIAFTLASPPADQLYKLTVTSDHGCSASDMVFVKFLKKLYIPNIFSPNGDGVHDKWIIQYLDSYAGCTVDIFNRYGQKIYHSEGYTTPWDGTVNGKPVPVGTYYYIVNPKNGRSQMSGYVDVIR